RRFTRTWSWDPALDSCPPAFRAKAASHGRGFFPGARSKAQMLAHKGEERDRLECHLGARVRSPAKPTRPADERPEQSAGCSGTEGLSHHRRPTQWCEGSV